MNPRFSGPLKWEFFNGPGGMTLFRFFTCFLTVTFTRQRFLHATLFARLQIEGMTLDFFDNVFLLDFPFKPA